MLFYIEMNGAPFIKEYNSLTAARHDVFNYCQAWNIPRYKILSLADAISIYGVEELEPLLLEVV